MMVNHLNFTGLENVGYFSREGNANLENVATLDTPQGCFPKS